LARGEEVRRRRIIPVEYEDFTKAMETIQAKPRELSRTKDGERRYDLRDWFIHLNYQGAREEAIGSVILLDRHRVVVAEGTAGGLEFLASVLNRISERLSVEVTAQLWEYEDDILQQAGERPRRIQDLRARSGGTLRLLDSNVVVTKEGAKIVGESKKPAEEKNATGAKKPSAAVQKQGATLGPFADGARGSIFTVVPYVQEVPYYNYKKDRTTVRMELDYQARAKRRDLPDCSVHVATRQQLKDGTDCILYVGYSGPAAAVGKARYHALSVGVRLIDGQGRMNEEARKEREAARTAAGAKNEELVRRALEDR
jgi:hypothetical protein